MNLQPQALFINPEVEKEKNCCLFLTENEKLSIIYFGIYESLKAVMSMPGYSKIYIQALQIKKESER